MIQTKPLLSDVTTTTTGSSITDFLSPGGAFQALVSGTGSVSATVIIECSLDGVNFIPLGTLSLSGTNVATDGLASLGEWVFYRARVTGISGTSAKVTVLMSDNV